MSRPKATLQLETPVASVRVPGFVGRLVSLGFLSVLSFLTLSPFAVFTRRNGGSWLPTAAGSTMIVATESHVRKQDSGNAPSVAAQQLCTCKSSRMDWYQESECFRRGEQGGDEGQNDECFESSLRFTSNKLEKERADNKNSAGSGRSSRAYNEAYPRTFSHCRQCRRRYLRYGQ